jgi:hypothetical protein
MSRETSASAGKPYGLQRVCRVLDIPRSTIYAQEQRQAANVAPRSTSWVFQVETWFGWTW